MRDDAVARLRNVACLAASLLTLTAFRWWPPAKPNVILVTARDFAFDLPASIPAAVTAFRLVNKGTQQHHISIVRLDGRHSAAEGLKALIDAGRGPRPAWLHFVGGPQGTAPGTESTATILLGPGNYLAFCEVPGPVAVPHYMKGMAKAFTVTGPARAGALPTADATLTLSEYKFTFARPLTRGRHTVAVTNAGTQGHMVVITRLPPGADYKPWLDWANDPRGRQAPGHPMGGATEIVPGGTTVFTENFTPGHYLMICFTADAKDGNPHFMHGMQQEFDVR